MAEKYRKISQQFMHKSLFTISIQDFKMDDDISTTYPELIPVIRGVFQKHLWALKSKSS